MATGRFPGDKDQSKSRIPVPKPEDLPPELSAYIKQFPSAKMDIAWLFAQAREVYRPYYEFSYAVIGKTTIPPMERELIVLTTLQIERGCYELAQHYAVAADMGIPVEKIEAIKNLDLKSNVFSRREKAIIAFTKEVVESVRVDDSTFNEISKFYDPRQLVESMFVIGNYMLVLRITEVARLKVDAVVGPEVIRDATARK